MERAFYERFAPRTHASCRVPHCFGTTTLDGSQVFALEDLDAAGFDRRLHTVTPRALDSALRFLASFHATFLGTSPEGLWTRGTYWHLATRPDELEATAHPGLKAAAAELDERLNRGRFRTLVHGDAKIANLCFRPDGSDIAAVDFQYVGGGCGMQDLAYFLGSCFDEDELARSDVHLDRYFEHLRAALHGVDVDLAALEREWRSLYPVAWADFARFLSGWSPGHHKLHRYTLRMVEQALAD